MSFLVEIATLYREKGVTKLRILPESEVTAAISNYELTESKTDAEKKKKSSTMATTSKTSK